jgi:hypothetical protein
MMKPEKLGGYWRVECKFCSKVCFCPLKEEANRIKKLGCESCYRKIQEDERLIWNKKSWNLLTKR